MQDFDAQLRCPYPVGVAPTEPNRAESSGDAGGAEPSDSLTASARLVAGHRFIERRLFSLTGGWSTDPATTAENPAMAVFLATQSQLHAWRLSQWEDRSPRSVDTDEAAPPGWLEALEHADLSGSAGARLACWSAVITPQLAARYLRHRSVTSEVAGAGTRRWLDIAIEDVLRGAGEGAAVLQRVGIGTDPVGEPLERVLRALTVQV